MNFKGNAEIVKRYLDANDWHYEVTEFEDRVLFSGGVNTGKGVFSTLKFHLLVDEGHIWNFTILPVGAGGKKAEIAEFITRVNYSLKSGGLDMDYDDGEIRYRLCVPAAAMLHDPEETLRMTLVLPGLMFMRYGDGIAKIIFGGVDPKTAYEQCD